MKTRVPSLADCVVLPISVRVPPDTPIKDVIDQMHENQDSCALIEQKQRLVGTFIERGLIYSAVLTQSMLEAPISTVMVPVADTIFAGELKDTFGLFQQMQRQHLHHLPVTDEKEKVIGIITQHSLRKALFPINVQQALSKKEANEQLLIEKVKGEFIAMVSHEMRTPLTSVHGSIRLLSQGIVSSESEQGQHLLKVAAENSERLVRLVNNILELEQLESGKSLLCKRLINTQDLSRRIVELSEPIARKKGVLLEITDEGLELIADCDRITQVIEHLLDNAIRISAAGSTIKITIASADQSTARSTAQSVSIPLIECSEATVLFTICDQGMGISPNHQHKIFERFVQGDRSYDQTGRTKARGTGIGLTICQNIVKQHNGRIWVESHQGKGSCFRFMLPTGCE